MIKTCLAFLEGKIYKVNQTNRKIYLSDGTEWNARLFHQNLNIVRQMRHTMIEHDDPEIRELRQVMTEAKEAYKKAMVEQITGLIAVKKFPMYACNKYVFKHGKYTGRTVAELVNEDVTYLHYMYANKPWFTDMVNTRYKQWARQHGFIR